MGSTNVDEKQRTTALAFWRYAHDYLRVARALADQHKLRASESQAVYHLAAQGLELALKAFLRARGVPAQMLQNEVGHSLVDALQRSCALGMPALPDASRACIETLAPRYQNTRFSFVDVEGDPFADVQPYVACGIQILERIVPDVVADYVDHHAAAGSPTAAEFAQRLRADLLATADGIALPS